MYSSLVAIENISVDIWFPTTDKLNVRDEVIVTVQDHDNITRSMLSIQNNKKKRTKISVDRKIVLI